MSDTAGELGRRTQVQPFWGRVSIQPLDVDETESPLLTMFSGAKVSRGVVLAVDELVLESARELIPPGTVVYYRGGHNVDGTIVIGASEIIAFEPL